MSSANQLVGAIFPRRYTAADIALLAGVDAAHEDLSGPAIRRVMQREHEVFGKKESVRLAGISVSHQFGLEQLDSEFVIHASPTPHATHRRKLLGVSHTRIRRAARRHCDPLQKSCSDARWSRADPKDDRLSHLKFNQKCSLVPQRLDRVDARRFHRRVDPENNSHHHRHAEGYDHRRSGHDRLPLRRPGDQPR